MVAMVSTEQNISHKAKQTCNCLLCSGTAELIEQQYPGYQEPLTFDIYHCSHCNTSFPAPRVETSQIYESIYKNGENVPGYKRYWQYLNSIKNIKNPLRFLAEKEEMYWAVRQTLQEINNNKSKKLLEVGCGLGYLTYSLVKEGYDVKGLDISKNAIEQAKNVFGDYYICADVFDYAPEHRDLYDVIILTEVIEHLNEPLKFLEALKLMLKQGGQIILTTPNKSAFPRNVSWATELPPVHLWWFSEDSMKFVANKLNAHVKFIDFTGFYKKKPCLIEINKFINKNPFLNKNGELINVLKEDGKFKSFLAGIRLLRLVNVKFKSFYFRTYVCKERGPIMGVIFQRK